MTARGLTPERESDIRLAVSYAEDPLAEPQRSLGWVLAELDAVRADRDHNILARLAVSGILDDAWKRAERAEATLAAIRDSVMRGFMTSEAKRLRADIVALLDAAPTETP
jgi:hypothetical protein